MSTNNGEFQAHTRRLEQVVQRVNALPDAGARATALELLSSLMDLHGTVLTRLLEIMSDTEAGRVLLDRLGGDPLVCGLLVLYDLHPVALETRVAHALETVQPRLRKQGGEVELIGISDGVVRVKIQGSGSGCGNSPDALKQSVQQAILEAAPEVIEVVAEGAAASAPNFVPLTMIQPASQKGEAYEKSAA